MRKDYNKPHFSKMLNRPLDNNTVFAEEWLLKQSPSPAMVWHHDGHQFVSDYKNTNKSVIVVGTELQNFHKFEEMLHKHAWQLQDTYSAELKENYLDAYEENANEPIIINII